MSDFLFSRTARPPGHLARHIRSIYAQDPPDIAEFHGAWGSLAISRILYRGFQPLDDAGHLCVIVGGPVLTFASNAFLAGSDDLAGSRLVWDRMRDGAIQWDKDLSGPFAVLTVDKTSGAAQVVTDMMSFIPVYAVERQGALLLGTQVDALARAAGCDKDVDAVSLADYVSSGAVTFPYTLYAPVWQLEPATVHRWETPGGVPPSATTYWAPSEENKPESLAAAAEQLRAALTDYVDRVTEGMDRVACFVSGGEDSRAVLAMLPRRLRRDAFIFLDAFNREGRIAQRAVEAFGADFKPFIRSPSFYLDIFHGASRLMGSTWEPRHAHTYEFHETANLVDYPAVFGGYLSDSLVKGHHVKKLKLGPLPFLPQVKRPVLSPESIGLGHHFPEAVLKAVRSRRKEHYQRIRALRPRSAAEWLTLWPASMRITMASFQASRRLIRTYEPFTAAGVVKIAAASPQRWKLNRRLFHRATQRLLAPAKWVPHSDGRLPYFSWTNLPAHVAGWIAAKFETARAQEKQGAWTSFDTMVKTDAWAEKSRELDQYLLVSKSILGEEISAAAPRWPVKYKLRLLQVLAVPTDLADVRESRDAARLPDGERV